LDQSFPPKLSAHWQSIEKDLNAASRLEFWCWVNFVSLHVFNDASKSALGVAAYLTQDLQILLSNFDLPAIPRTLTLKHIYFSYIPAHSPHWGGVYERFLGLSKKSLKKF